jgi:hypothetical protein
MKRIALAALLALSTLAHADDATIITFVATDAGPHQIDIAAAPGSPRIARTATILNWMGEASFSAGYEIVLTADLVPGNRYHVLVYNVTPRGVPSCGDAGGCPVVATVSRL